MSTQPRNRQPSGTPTGGEFTTGARTGADVALTTVSQFVPMVPSRPENLEVSTQGELDEALERYGSDPKRTIVINSPPGVWLSVRETGDATVRVTGDATVLAFENAALPV